jgi:hypothetical protein
MAFGSRDEACYVTRLVLLRALRPRQQAQCEALRREAGRCWSDRGWCGGPGYAWTLTS